MAAAEAKGEAALSRLRSEELPAWLAPSTELSEAVRTASEHLFAALAPHCPKCPLDKLFVDGFDAEQIWQQIDLQALAILPSLRREIRRLERNPPGAPENRSETAGFEAQEEEESGEEQEDEGDEEEEEESGEEEEDEGDEEEEEEEGGGIEDRFLKVKDLETFLEEEERREFGGRAEKTVDDADEEGSGEEEDDDGDDQVGSAGDDDGTEVNEKSMKYPRYDDFFGNKKKKKNQNMQIAEPDNLEIDDEDDNNGNAQDQLLDEAEDPLMGDVDTHKQEAANLSTYEKQQEKVHSKIKQMEKANLEPKAWTMQGEVTAAKRPKNSALEVDLDFEHNVRPAPVITEEVTASLEDIIKQRIVEGRFDDVQRIAGLASKEPRKIKELDENKSQKSLAEIYEEEYMQKTGLAHSPLTFRDELKKEASLLFKQLCLKLDALSHFHFAPKPVIEDMSIQTNVPALAMEEVAPLAVSDAAMLAPEEVFAGKGDIKEEGELTQAERKRRRAKIKRKFKAESNKRLAKKVHNQHNENGVVD